jgi:GDSL-like Lipase/Acylhydrolase family
MLARTFASLLALALAECLALPSEAAAGPGSRATAIVSMGDSFISGEGGRWMGNGIDPFGTRSGTDRAAFDCGWAGCRYDPHLVYGASEDDGCHRSDVAPIRSAPIKVGEKANLACSGAKTLDLWPGAAGGESLRGERPQADQLGAIARRDDVRLIVVTVGANDIGFGELVVECALDWARSDLRSQVHCARPAQQRILAAEPSARRGLEGALRGIRMTMARAGYLRGDYRLLVMGYASPFPVGSRIRYPEGGWSRLREGGCPLWNADADWAERRATPTIDATMRAAAHATNAEYLDLQHALDGHQLCDRRSRRAGPAGPDPRSAEWVRRLSFAQGSTRESLHPNAYGQRAIGACIALQFSRPPGDYACRAQPGRGYAGAIGLERLG